MLHFLPQDSGESQAVTPCPEAVARLSSIRRALSLVEDFSGGAEDYPDLVDPLHVVAAWPQLGRARQHRFSDRTRRVAGVATVGLEAIVAKPWPEAQPNPAAVSLLAKRLHEDLTTLGHLLAE